MCKSHPHTRTHVHSPISTHTYTHSLIHPPTHSRPIQLSEQPGFVSVMMYVLGHPNANPYIQQAGATYFKNFLYRFWEKRSRDEEKYFSVYCVYKRNAGKLRRN